MTQIRQSRMLSGEETLLTRAAIRAADHLDISAKTLARTIGVSEAGVSRMRSGQLALPQDGKPFELALLFVRLFRSLDALCAGDNATARAWLVNANTAFGERPLSVIQTVQGLVNVVAYLDARRAPL